MVFQEILRNSNITIEAKGLYAYLAGFSGAGDECYPSIGLMCDEIGISKTRLYKHMAVLVQFGVVEKVQTYNGNIKGKVIYKLTHTVNFSDSRFPEIGETEKQCDTVSENLGIRDFGIPKNEEIKNNIINNKNNKQCASDNAPKASQSEINAFFESIWSLYPNKKGKGQVSDVRKRKLYDIGYDEISRAIDRYKDGLLKDDWRKPQNGSTFFNSGYVDYLDTNYSKPQNRQEIDAEQQRAQRNRDYEENCKRLRKMLGTPRPTQPDDPFQ